MNDSITATLFYVPAGLIHQTETMQPDFENMNMYAVSSSHPATFLTQT